MGRSSKEPERGAFRRLPGAKTRDVHRAPSRRSSSGGGAGDRPGIDDAETGEPRRLGGEHRPGGAHQAVAWHQEVAPHGAHDEAQEGDGELLRQPAQLPIALLSLVVCAVGSYLLVPRYGLVGAAWAVLATEATRLACLGVVYAGAVASASSAARPPRGRAVHVPGLRAGQATEGAALRLFGRSSHTARPGAVNRKASP